MSLEVKRENFYDLHNKRVYISHKKSLHIEMSIMLKLKALK